MGLFIKSPEAEILANRLAELTAETVEDVVVNSLRERIDRIDPPADTPRGAEIRVRRQQIDTVLARVDRLPLLDERDLNDIIGYDERGLPR